MFKKIIMLILFSVLLAAAQVWAWTAPATGDLAYDIYDVVVNDIVQGPIGFAAGVGMLAFGAYLLAARSMIFQGIAPILAGVALIKSDTIIQTLGWLV